MNLTWVGLILILGLVLWMWDKSQQARAKEVEALRSEAQKWRESFATQLTLELMDDQEVMDGLRKGNWKPLQGRVNDSLDQQPIDGYLQRYTMTNKVGEQLMAADRHRKEAEKIIGWMASSGAEGDRIGDENGSDAEGPGTEMNTTFEGPPKSTAKVESGSHG